MKLLNYVMQTNHSQKQEILSPYSTLRFNLLQLYIQMNYSRYLVNHYIKSDQVYESLTTS